VDTLSIEDKLKWSIINGEKTIGDGATKKSLADYWKRRSSPTRRWSLSTTCCSTECAPWATCSARARCSCHPCSTRGRDEGGVAYLEPKMEKKEGSQKATIVLATVKGDVHDIGKNLVDIILTNNGYRL